MAYIAVDEGHGLYTPGKRCLKSLDPKQTREWVLNHQVGVHVINYLKKAGHEILLVSDADGSSDVSLASRVARANNADVDFYLSLHHNAGVGGGAGGGTVVIVSKRASYKSIQAQNAIYNRAVQYAGLKGDRWDGTVAQSLYVLNNTTMPACLIECGFMDSRNDIKYILDPNWSKKIALGIAQGVCDVFGGKISESPVSAPKEEIYYDYYKEPINWAIKNGITAEKDLKSFNPNKNCTRAQAITFLWRAEGCPEPKQLHNPFHDIKASDYSYKAVLWAMENGITAGTDIGKFGPDEPCTRAQVVTFLWRVAGQPESAVKETSFEDVKADAYYYDAVLWADERDIASGVEKNVFAPDKACTRGQVVTFLYRAKN